MRCCVIALSSCLVLLPAVAALHSTTPRHNDVTTANRLPHNIRQQKQLAAAGTMPEAADDDDHHHPIQPAVRLSDTLGSNRALTTFSSLARQGERTAERLGSGADSTTVLAPLNSAVEGLPRKPWEDAQQLSALGADAYEGEDGKDRADANLRRFVEAHLVPQSPWPAGTKVKTLAGGEVWWEEGGDGKRVIMPDKVEVDKVAIEVGNGQIWILKGVLRY
ncbi:hypothetical protein PWT90_06895 [Aphanocladium album]|nr:hypothetical protein PWT90_06895 [Aphanocladium album]